MEDANILKQIYSQQRVLIEKLDEAMIAQIAIDKADRPTNVRRVVLDLSKEQDELSPYRLGYSFKSIFVEHSDDPGAKIYVKPTTTEAHQSFFALSYRDSWGTSRGTNDAFIHWPVQSGTMTLIIFVDSEFKSGSQVAINAGQMDVSIAEGVTVKDSGPQVIPPATATEVFPADPQRKTSTFQNKTGASVFVSGSNSVSNTGATEGFEFPDGALVTWRNKGPLHVYSVGGGKIIKETEV